MSTSKKQYQAMTCDYSNKKAVMARFRHSFGKGVGSVMSLHGGYIRLPLGDTRTDVEQLRCDWESVGNDIRSTIRKAKK